MPYHVRITLRSNPSHDEVKLDLSRELLEKRFLRPYYEGRPIVIGGRTIPVEDIQRIRITYTNEGSEAILPRVRAKRRASNVLVPISDEWFVAAEGDDVTDELITGPPGAGIEERPDAESGPSVRGPRVVFVVHGRNRELRDSMFSFLRALGLHPLEWTEALLATGKPAPYVGEALTRRLK